MSGPPRSPPSARRRRTRRSSARRSIRKAGECEGGPAPPLLQRDVAVLAAGPRLALGEERLKRGDDLGAGLVGDDHIVDVPALSRRVRVRETRLVVVDELLAALVRGR